jgi:hypothetical protein
MLVLAILISFTTALPVDSIEPSCREPNSIDRRSPMMFLPLCAGLLATSNAFQQSGTQPRNPLPLFAANGPLQNDLHSKTDIMHRVPSSFSALVNEGKDPHEAMWWVRKQKAVHDHDHDE